MSVRPWVSHPDAVAVECDGQVFSVKAVGDDQVYIEADTGDKTPGGPVRVRGIDYNASAHFKIRNGIAELSGHHVYARRAHEMLGDEASPAAKRSIEALFKQAAEIFALRHDETMKEGNLAAIAQDIHRVDTDILKLEKELSSLREKRDELLREEAELSGGPSAPGLR